MQAGQQVIVRAGSSLASPDPNAGLFTATLAQNAALTGRIRLPEAVAAGRVARSVLRAIQVTSFDRLDWEFWFWRNQQFQNSGAPALEDLAGVWTFSTGGGDGIRIAGTGLYYYYIDGLGILYEDHDAHDTPTLGAFLNTTLVNRSAGAKTANQWFDVQILLEPTLGW